MSVPSADLLVNFEVSNHTFNHKKLSTRLSFLDKINMCDKYLTQRHANTSGDFFIAFDHIP